MWKRSATTPDRVNRKQVTNEYISYIFPPNYYRRKTAPSVTPALTMRRMCRACHTAGRTPHSWDCRRLTRRVGSRPRGGGLGTRSALPACPAGFGRRRREPPGPGDRAPGGRCAVELSGGSGGRPDMASGVLSRLQATAAAPAGTWWSLRPGGWSRERRGTGRTPRSAAVAPTEAASLRLRREWQGTLREN